jgi:hypothetical protein
MAEDICPYAQARYVWSIIVWVPLTVEDRKLLLEAMGEKG